MVEPLEEYRRRIRDDLLVCRQTIERELDKRVKALAWPIGKTNQEAMRAARDAGYIVAFGLQTGDGSPLNRARYYSPQSWDTVMARIPPALTAAPAEPPLASRIGIQPSPASASQLGLWPVVRNLIVGAVAGALVWGVLYRLAMCRDNLGGRLRDRGR